MDFRRRLRLIGAIDGFQSRGEGLQFLWMLSLKHLTQLRVASELPKMHFPFPVPELLPSSAFLRGYDLKIYIFSSAAIGS